MITKKVKIEINIIKQMRQFFIILALGIVSMMTWLPATWAKDQDTITLAFKSFDDKTHKSKEVSKLKELVFNEFRDPNSVDGYIQLTNTEFLIFATYTARIAMGLHLVDISTNTINEEKVLGGFPSIVSALKDKSGNDFLLLSLYSTPHGGEAGTSYYLMSARRSMRGHAVIDLKLLGQTEDIVSDGIEDICKWPGNAERIIYDNVDATFTDVNKDGYPDITINLKQINCKNGKTKIFSTNYYSSSYGFKSQVTKNPNGISLDLLKAQNRALEIFSKTKNRGDAADILEKAGVWQYIYDKPAGMSIEVYASILNDYAFYRGPYNSVWQNVDILDRVIQLSPRRAVAYLNRAEVLYIILAHGEIKTQSEKISTAKEIMRDYLTYKTFSGNTIDKWEKFSAFNLASYPDGITVCEFVQQYHNAGRLDYEDRENEIYLETRRLDINNDGHIDDVIFEHGKYGYKTYGGFIIKNANGDPILFKESVTQKPVSKKPNTGYGFKVFEFEGKVYKSLPMLDISYIDHDKEKLVCESDWEEIGNGRRTLKSIKKIE